MEYRLSLEQFKNSKMFDSKGKLYHKSGYRFKLFPFVTQNNSEPVLKLEPVIGCILCRIEGKEPKQITSAELVEKLKAETEISPGYEELFAETIRQLFFSADGTLRPMNLQMIEQITSNETNEIRVAEYLVDVLGDTDVLKGSLLNAKSKSAENVLEALVLSKLEYKEPSCDKKELKYFRIIDSLHTSFEEDFAYVLEDTKRLREYLVQLLEFYYFSYTAQTSLQLNRFWDGERDNNIPLYFSLDWEKTSQSRLCYTEGWQKLQSAIEKIFAHAITLEILNQTTEDSELVDYIRLNEIVENSDKDNEISTIIDSLTDLYRKSITDCVEMNELEKKSSAAGLTATSVKYLYDSVRVQFENRRNEPYERYAKKFVSYCERFLKNRGRSGKMLSLTEEDLIFLTKLCIKNQEQMRLKDVFHELEKRGVFLDDISREQATVYYEKLNLIEKKSDSGDAKYVKRIL